MSVITAAAWESSSHPAGEELVDGIVRPRGRPTARHDQIKAALREVLAGLVPASMTVAADVEVRLDDLVRRRPDLLVIRGIDETLPDTGAVVDPESVALAVEVVCAGSETTDRKHKRLEYADADIPHYWRVETTTALGVHTYRLGESSVYLETGLFREGDQVADPTLRWATFEVNDLLPGAR